MDFFLSLPKATAPCVSNIDPLTTTTPALSIALRAFPLPDIHFNCFSSPLLLNGSRRLSSIHGTCLLTIDVHALPCLSGQSQTGMVTMAQREKLLNNKPREPRATGCPFMASLRNTPPGVPREQCCHRLLFFSLSFFFFPPFFLCVCLT